jgi:hypothetical protein
MKEYQNNLVNKRTIICITCNQEFSSESALSRHKNTIHVTKHQNLSHCWICGISWRRLDNYHRHNQSIRHQQNLQKYLLPAEKTHQTEENTQSTSLTNGYTPQQTYLPQLTTDMEWYARIDSIENISESPRYAYVEKAMRKTPVEIPLEMISKQLDPHIKDETIKLDLSELVKLFPTEVDQPPWLKKPFITKEDSRAYRIQDSLMDLLLSDMSVDDIIKRLDNPPLLEDRTAQPPAAIPTEHASPDSSIAMLNINTEEEEDWSIPENFNFSVEDMDTFSTWLTLDAVGQTISEHNLLPPMDFLDI